MATNDAGDPMPTIPKPTIPTTLPTLGTALREVERDVAEFFGTLPPDVFAARMGEAWSPAEHLSHLNTAVRAVALAFSVPPWLLRLRFGKAHRPSRSYETLRDDYRAVLAAGGKASGVYVPRPEALPSRDALLERWARVNGHLRKALARWSEQELDRVVLPHPLLGKLTARELAYFTVYHGGHHVAAARRRLEAGTA